MTFSFLELSIEERKKLLFDFLKYVEDNPNKKISEIREEFAKKHNLSIYASTRISDFAWFSDMVTFKPRTALLDKGKDILKRGRVEIEDIFPYFRKRFLFPSRRYLQVRVVDGGGNLFKFYIRKAWEYKVFVETPIYPWAQRWQGPISGMDTPQYSVKHRTIMFVQTANLSKDPSGKPTYITNIKWVEIPPHIFKSGEREQHRIDVAKKMNILPSQKPRPRTIKYDPNNTISVHLIEKTDGRMRWVVDFTNGMKGEMKSTDFLTKEVNLEEVRRIMEERNKEVIMSRLWE